MIGTRLGQYRIEALLGQGGMGAVYLATDDMLDRQVAIKVLRDDSRDENTAIERFRKEAQILSRLEHPNILRLYGFSQDRGVLYMVTEYVKGEPLQRRLELGVALETTQVLEWASQVLDALDYAHQLGVVHRDIKPANILIDQRGRARLLDFGIARIVGSEGLTQTGQAVGTLTYMAPEQVLDEAIDGRADLYAFAVVLCQMFAGRRPYRSTTTAGLIREIVDGPAPDVTALLPATALVFAPTLTHALARRPADRTPTAARMRDELLGAARGAQITSHGLPPTHDGVTAGAPATAAPGPGTATSDVLVTSTGVAPTDVRRPQTATDARATTPTQPPMRRAGALGLLAPVLLLCAGAGVGWYVIRSSRPVTPRVVSTPAAPGVPASASTAPPAAAAAPTSVAPPSDATTPRTAPPTPPAPGTSSDDTLKAPAAPAAPGTRPPRSATARTSTVPRPSATTTAPAVAEPPTPVPAPLPVVEAPAPSTAPKATAAVPATAEFKDIILIDRIDDEDEEIDATLRLDALRVVVVDEDGLAKRSIAYDAIGRATYHTRRPGRFSLRRSASHWLTLEVGTTPIVLRLNGRTYEQVLTTLQGHGVNVVRNP